MPFRLWLILLHAYMIWEWCLLYSVKNLIADSRSLFSDSAVVRQNGDFLQLSRQSCNFSSTQSSVLARAATSVSLIRSSKPSRDWRPLQFLWPIQEPLKRGPVMKFIYVIPNCRQCEAGRTPSKPSLSKLPWLPLPLFGRQVRRTNGPKEKFLPTSRVELRGSASKLNSSAFGHSPGCFFLWKKVTMSTSLCASF